VAVLVDVEKVTARTAERVLFADLSLTVSSGERVGVIGINGTGKSTLLRVVAGAATPDSGTVRRGRDSVVAFLPQEPVLAPGPVRAVLGEGWEADAALDRLGMAGLADADTATLSGGQVKRVALAAALAHPADLLVLDEPTNHLDLGGVTWLESRLLAHRGGLVLVSHDRHLLDRVTTRMLELDRGVGFVHEGGYASYLAARAEREERAGEAEDTRRNLARRELAWLRRGAPARSRKPKARIRAALDVVDGRPPPPARRSELDLGVIMPRLGDKVVELSGVSYRYRPAGPDVVADVDLVLDPRERLGVVGANGAGKSTLLDLIAGRREPTAGRREIGPTVVAGYYDQRGVDLDPDARVRDLVAGPHRVPGGPEDVALMARFWFDGELAFAPVRTLSGGERRRLQLLVVLAGRPNLLVLDEPTNDLDVDTLRALEDLVEDWPGAVVVASHDRTLLRRCSERVVAMDAAGGLRPVPGGIDGWLAAAGLGPSAGSGPSARGLPAGSAGRDERVAPARPTPGRTDGRAAGAAPGRCPDGPAGAAARGDAGRRLRELDKELARLARQQTRLADALASTSEHEQLAALGRDLAGLQERIARTEEEWLLVAEAAEEAGAADR